MLYDEIDMRNKHAEGWIKGFWCGAVSAVILFSLVGLYYNV